MVPVTNIICPVPNCNKRCKNTIGLRVHLTKKHTAQEKDNIVNQQPPTPQDPSLSQGIQQPSSFVDTNDVPNFPLLSSHLQSLKSKVRLLKRIPKASRLVAVQEFTLINECNIHSTSHDGWIKLLTFVYVALKRPDPKDKTTSKLSLATVVKRNLNQWMGLRSLPFIEYLNAITPTSVNPRRAKKDASVR